MRKFLPLCLTVAVALTVALPATAVAAPVAKAAAAKKAAAVKKATPVDLPEDPTGLTAPVTLPAALDATPRYLPQNACMPSEQPGIKKLRDLVLATYGVGGRGNASRSCAVAGTSEHKEGRAWDWMVNVKNPAEVAAAADFLAWLTAADGANAKRLGVMYVIYNKKIWAAYRAKDGWRTSSGHTDHVHVSLSWNGARGNTSFWTGKTFATDFGPCARFAGQPAVIRNTPRTTACTTPAALVKKTSYKFRAYGSSAASVKTAQKVLGIARTGRFDLATQKKVKAYQKAHDLPVTGTLDQPTWASMVPSKVTKDASKAFGTAGTKALTSATYSTTSLAQHSAGKAVLLLQIALRLPLDNQNGFFGPNTVAAVKKLQKAAGLPETGKVKKAEWSAIRAGVS